MNEQLIEIVLVLFWAGFVGMNLWLWKSTPLDQSASAQKDISHTEVNEGERHATYHH